MPDCGANHILPQPAQPSWWKECPYCEQVRTLKLEQIVPDSVAAAVYVYQCQFCFEEVEFAEAHPPGAI